MRYFVTGATGYIGLKITERLVEQGHEVKALFRSPGKAKGLPAHRVEPVKGDLLDPDSLVEACRGCDAVFHIAAFAKPWAKDPKTYFEINVEGALHVARAAADAGARRLVFTSTAGVISPSQNGQPSDEYTPRWVDYFTDYERSKALAEKELLKLCQSNSLELVIVNPTRVYGPGLLSDSNGVTRMVKMYLEGRFRLLPGDGTSIGNYVYIDDVVEGHLAAMEKGTPGERYILGGENASFRQFFDILTQVSGKQLRLFNVPVGVMKFAARLMELRADLTGRAPLLTPPWVNKYLYHWELSSKKAAEELGYAPLPLAEGLRRTVEWLQCQEQSKTQR